MVGASQDTDLLLAALDAPRDTVLFAARRLIFSLLSTQPPRCLSVVAGLGESERAHVAISTEREKIPCRGLVFVLKTTLEHCTRLLAYQRATGGLAGFLFFTALAVRVRVPVPWTKTYGNLLAHMGSKSAVCSAD